MSVIRLNFVRILKKQASVTMVKNVNLHMEERKWRKSQSSSAIQDTSLLPAQCSLMTDTAPMGADAFSSMMSDLRKKLKTHIIIKQLLAKVIILRQNTRILSSSGNLQDLTNGSTVSRTSVRSYQRQVSATAASKLRCRWCKSPIISINEFFIPHQLLTLCEKNKILKKKEKKKEWKKNKKKIKKKN